MYREYDVKKSSSYYGDWNDNPRRKPLNTHFAINRQNTSIIV